MLSYFDRSHNCAKKYDERHYTSSTGVCRNHARARVYCTLLVTIALAYICCGYLKNSWLHAHTVAKHARLQSVQLDDEGNEICDIASISHPYEFLHDLNATHDICHSKVEIGHYLDKEEGTDSVGMRDKLRGHCVCLDKRLKLKHDNCLVYSIGLRANFTFERAINQLGCEVHVFDTDPSVRNDDTLRNVRFYDVSVGTKSFDAYSESSQVKKARNLHSVIEELGHTHRVIDVLKVDVRDHEWDTLVEFVNSAALDQVKQLLVTLNLRRLGQAIHDNAVMRLLQTYYDLLRMLDCDGFRSVAAAGWGARTHVPHSGVHFHAEYDVTYVNVNYYRFTAH